MPTKLRDAVEHLRWLAANSRELARAYPHDEVAPTDLQTARAIDVVLRELRKHCPEARSCKSIRHLMDRIHAH
jgi:hypothetical protein